MSRSTETFALDPARTPHPDAALAGLLRAAGREVRGAGLLGVLANSVDPASGITPKGSVSLVGVNGGHLRAVHDALADAVRQLAENGAGDDAARLASVAEQWAAMAGIDTGLAAEDDLAAEDAVPGDGASVTAA